MSTTTSTDPQGNGSTTDLQALLNLIGSGSAPQVPGYSTGGFYSGGMMGATGGPQITVAGNTLTLSTGFTGNSLLQTGQNTPLEPSPQQPRAIGSRQIQTQQVIGTPLATSPQTETLQQALTNFYNQLNSDTTFKDTFAQEAKQAGLISSATASKAELLIAFQAVAEQAVSTNQSWQSVIQQASTAGWTSLKPNRNVSDYGLTGTGNLGNAPDPSTSTTETDYTSYMDPATAQGALADAIYRLDGRMPTTQEYQQFLQGLYSYQQDVNQGTFEQTQSGKTGDAQTGTNTTTQKNEITQRGIGTRGAEFLAGQQAMQSPDYATYQAATTYFNAFMKALTGPASGMTGSGPDVTAP